MLKHFLRSKQKLSCTLHDTFTHSSLCTLTPNVYRPAHALQFAVYEAIKDVAGGNQVGLRVEVKALG